MFTKIILVLDITTNCSRRKPPSLVGSRCWIIRFDQSSLEKSQLHTGWLVKARKSFFGAAMSRLALTVRGAEIEFQ